MAAARRCIEASAQVGGSMLLIDAKDQRAADCYRSCCAIEKPKMPLSLELPYLVFIDVMRKAGSSIV